MRRPGSAWTELPRPAGADTEPIGHIRLGYARASTARQSLDSQLDALAEVGVSLVFSEKICTRATRRPELEKAVGLARQVRASGACVILVVHEHQRLGRGLDLAALAEDLKASDIGLEFLTGELQGSHDPSGVVFTVLAALSGMEREYIRDRTLEGHESARKRGKTIGGAGVADDHMVSMAVRLRNQEMSLRDIASRLVITTPRKAGRKADTRRGLRRQGELYLGAARCRSHRGRAGPAEGLLRRSGASRRRGRVQGRCLSSLAIRASAGGWLSGSVRQQRVRDRSVDHRCGQASDRLAGRRRHRRASCLLGAGGSRSRCVNGTVWCRVGRARDRTSSFRALDMLDPQEIGAKGPAVTCMRVPGGDVDVGGGLGRRSGWALLGRGV
ncbi:recombinase family protein [Embleya sp. NPDC008237]|uniref:recombinase family protein n=1 Tax=Embleya sp. NPDC008237 TaxID=3363978 RepID=UPI0036EF548A